LVYPGIRISTPWAYGLFRLPLTKKRSIHKIKERLTRGKPPKNWAHLMFNRFEDVVIPKIPEIGKIKATLIAAGCRNSLMSGSGSSVFGVVDSVAVGRRVVKLLRRKSWDICLIRAEAS